MIDIDVFKAIVGRNYQQLNQYLGITDPATFNFGKDIVPVFDLTRVTQPGEVQVFQQSVTPVTGTTTIDLTPKVGYDDYYLGLSLTLGVARTINMFIVGGPNLIATSSSATLQVPINSSNAVYIPNGNTLRISVNSSNAADGTITVGIYRIERPVGLGPLSV